MIKEVPFVSVIIPLYNVAPYVEKCARSIFEQTLENLEIIFIDDCSPDNSVDIVHNLLSQYPKRKHLTKIIRRSENAGLSGVRKQGILEATGIFIIHCDGDDWVDKELYKTMYEAAIANNADIVVCDLMDELKDKHIHRVMEPIIESPHDYLKNYHNRIYHMSCCNKLIKRSIFIDNDVFPWIGLNMWEDNALTTRVFYYGSKFAFVKDVYYHYNRTNENAMTLGYGIRQVDQMINVAKNLRDFFESRDDSIEYKKTSLAFQYLARINLITDSFKNYRRFKRTFPESKSIARELDPNAFSSKGRFRFNMVRYGMAWLFILMFKIRNLIFKS